MTGKIDFYTYSIKNLEKVLTKYKCDFDKEGIINIPSEMKIMWDYLSVTEQQKFSQKNK